MRESLSIDNFGFADFRIARYPQFNYFDKVQVDTDSILKSPLLKHHVDNTPVSDRCDRILVYHYTVVRFTGASGTNFVVCSVHVTKKHKDEFADPEDIFCERGEFDFLRVSSAPLPDDKIEELEIISSRDTFTCNSILMLEEKECSFNMVQLCIDDMNIFNSVSVPINIQDLPSATLYKSIYHISSILWSIRSVWHRGDSFLFNLRRSEPNHSHYVEPYGNYQYYDVNAIVFRNGRVVASSPKETWRFSPDVRECIK